MRGIQGEALLADLAELVSIPSVSPDPACADELERAAEWVANRIGALGAEAELCRRPGTPSLVLGEARASQNPRGARDVLVYAHFDVQPAGPLELWESQPFALVERDGQLFGRGVADDKANLVILLNAVEALAKAGDLPVNVRFVVDGEEEIGGSSADEWLLDDERGASVALLLDGSFDELTVGIRGMLYGHVHLRTGATEQHSGLYGGAALSATESLLRTLAAVLPGPDGLLPAPLRTGVQPAVELERQEWLRLPSGPDLLAEAGLRPADAMAARDFHLRTRAEPALTIHGVASGHACDYSATLPVDARANFSLRPVSGQSAADLAETVEQLLHEACPEGAALTIDWRFRYGGASSRFHAPELSVAADAIERSFGRRPAVVRTGGSLPLFETLAERGTPVIATGFAVEGEANMHGPNECFPAAHLPRGVAAVTDMLTHLA